MAIRLGLQAVTLFKVAGVADPGPWTPLTNLKDLTLNLETGEADVTTRGAQGWRLTASTLRDASIEGELLWVPDGDPGFAAVRNAFLAGRPIGILALDGGIERIGSEGLMADMSVMSFSRKEPLEEALSVDLTLKPTFSALPPQWVRVTAPGVVTPVEI